MGDYFFASPCTANPLVKDNHPLDFNMWYNGREGYITPLLGCTFSAKEWQPILASGNSNWLSDSEHTMAAGELKYGKGVFRVCELQLVDRIKYNPTAFLFLSKLTKQ